MFFEAGVMLHSGFFLWQELPLKHPERMRSPMPQAAFYGDWGRTRSGGPRFGADRNGVETSPTSRAVVSRKPCLQKKENTKN